MIMKTYYVEFLDFNCSKLFSNVFHAASRRVLDKQIRAYLSEDVSEGLRDLVCNIFIALMTNNVKPFKF